MDTDRVVSRAEAARRLEVCQMTVTRAVRAGVLRAKWGGLRATRVVGIYEDSLEALIASTRGGAK